MGKHPINLALRFILEVIALAVFAFWGWQLASGWKGVVLAVVLPVFFAVIWGVFAVKDDPGRSGKTVVPTKGILRLLLEIVFFGLAARAIFDLVFQKAGLIFSVIVILHYIISYDRLRWLIKQ